MKALLIAAMLFCGQVNAGGIYLYVMFHDDNSKGERFRTEMTDMKECLRAIKSSKMPMPDSPSGDYEVMGAMWCGGGMDRNYNGTWWHDPKKSHDK